MEGTLPDQLGRYPITLKEVTARGAVFPVAVEDRSFRQEVAKKKRTVSAVQANTLILFMV